MSITVAVTGGTGFIGKHIIDDLLSRGFAVRALTRTIRHDVRDNLVWIRGRWKTVRHWRNWSPGRNMSSTVQGRFADTQKRSSPAAMLKAAND